MTHSGGETSFSNDGNVNDLTDSEKALYDRQIRLWGFGAQNRLRNSAVLIAGLSGCGTEVAKNLMLAGVKSLTFLDSNQVTEKDLSCNVFIEKSSIGENCAKACRRKCQILNPNVKLYIDTDSITDKDEEYLKNFNLVILMDQKYSVIKKINEICRKNHVRFEAGGVYGWVGYAFFDFNGHNFLINAPKKEVSYVDCAAIDEEILNSPSSSKKMLIDGLNRDVKPLSVIIDDDEKIKLGISFPSWEVTMNVDWSQKKFIRKARTLPHCYFPIRALLRASDQSDHVDSTTFLKFWEEELEKSNQKGKYQTAEDDVKFYLGRQLSPACAIVGAIIAQEAIKALSENDAPLENLFIYSALDVTGVVCHIPSYV